MTFSPREDLQTRVFRSIIPRSEPAERLATKAGEPRAANLERLKRNSITFYIVKLSFACSWVFRIVTLVIRK